MVLSNSMLAALFHPNITLLGSLRGVYVGYNYTYNGLLSTLNIQVGFTLGIRVEDFGVI